MPEKQTIVINNFGGRLTRVLNGELNSGFAKFVPSFGYDPFTKPGNLTWLDQPSSVAGVNDVIVAGINRGSGLLGVSGATFVVGTSSLFQTTGNLYKIDVANYLAPNRNSVLAIQSIHGNFDYGASMEFFGIDDKLFVSGSTTIITTGSVTAAGVFNLNGSSSVIGNSALLPTGFHPLKKFVGKLLFGNGPTIGAIDNTNTIISSIFTISKTYGNQYSQLNPPLPSEQFVKDLDVSIDNNYLKISTSAIQSEFLLLPSADAQYANPVEGGIFGWNGVDQGVTTGVTVPSGTSTALQNYLQSEMLFFNDSFGTAVGNMERKLLTLPDNKSPVPNATGVNGNFLAWVSPESVDNGTRRVASMYYFGSLDEDNPVGLYRLLRFQPPLVGGLVYQAPYQALVSNAYKTVAAVGGYPNSSINGTKYTSLGKHYFSTFNMAASVMTPGATGTKSFMSFNVTSDGINQPQLGVYETQTQMFPKRISVEQIRVYTESTVSGNGFKIDIVGADGTVITNGTFNYSFVAGSDITKLQGSLQRINFNPTADAGYGCAIRITNTGTVNWTCKKIEVDISPKGR